MRLRFLRWQEADHFADVEMDYTTGRAQLAEVVAALEAIIRP
jgi:hypothetical protein